MKEVMAVVRLNAMNKTKRALADAGITSITAKEALGRGKGLVDFQVLKGAEKGCSSKPKPRSRKASRSGAAVYWSP